jgi:hypothetical protein
MASWIEACAADGIANEHVGYSGRTTGAVEGAPVWINNKTYPVNVEGDKAFIDIG